MTQWLLNPKNGKWISVFDNANARLNFAKILPNNVTWGKSLITTRTADVMVISALSETQTSSMQIPRLSANEAYDLFVRRCEGVQISERQRREVSGVTTAIRSRNLAIVLASICFQAFQTVTDLDLPCEVSSENIDPLIHHWTVQLLDDMQDNERTLLQFFVLLGRRCVPMDIVSFCQRSRRQIGNLQMATDFLKSSNTDRIVQNLVSRGFLERQSSPQGQVWAIPSSVANAAERELNANHMQTLEIVQVIVLLLISAQDEVNGLSSSISGNLIKTISGFRNVCVMAQEFSITIPDGTTLYRQLGALSLIEKANTEGGVFGKRTFWRQWLSSFAYLLPAYLTDDEKQSPLTTVPQFKWPIWMHEHLPINNFIDKTGKEMFFRDALLDKPWDQPQLAIMLARMGHAWHGIRDDVFDFAGRNFHPDFS